MEWLPVVVVIALLIIAGLVAWAILANNDNTSTTPSVTPISPVVSAVALARTLLLA